LWWCRWQAQNVLKDSCVARRGTGGAGIDLAISKQATVSVTSRLEEPALSWGQAESDRLRIVHIIAPGPYGGAESVVRSLAAAQGRVGHEVHVVAVLDPGPAETHPFVAAVRADGSAAHPVMVPLRAYRQERATVRQLCQGIGADVIHTHGYRADVLHGSLGRFLRIPLVTTVHGSTEGGWSNRFYQFLQRLAWRRYDGVVAVSRPLHAELQRRQVGDRLHCVPNAWEGTGVPLDRASAQERLGVDGSGFRVGFVGRLGREKGADIFLEAIARVPDPGIVASIIGDGPERTTLEAQAARLGIDHRVQWHGAVHDAGSLLAALDALVLSSRSEGTPMVLFEAMAAGTPIVAARVGGVPDVVSVEDAVLVEPESPGALAAAIHEVRDAPAEARARARRAGERLQTEFAIGPWLQRYDDVYRAARRASAGRQQR
jgi:glycosyltransferase involved in cell wall biosynthesis